ARAFALCPIPRFGNEDVPARGRDFVAGDVHQHSRLSALADVDSRIGVNELPVGARRLRILIHLDLAQRRRIEPEPRLDLALGDRTRLLARKAGAGTPLRKLVHDLSHLSVPVDRDAPFLRAIGDVDTGEPCVTY